MENKDHLGVLQLLSPFAAHCDMNRLQMFSSHVAQMIPIENSEIPLALTVYSNEITKFCGKEISIRALDDGEILGKFTIDGKNCLLVKYDEFSPSRVSDLNGKPVGIISSKNKWVFWYRKSYWQISRIVLCLFDKLTDDSLVVDHIDGIGLDNTLDNLRLVTQQVNSLNRKRLCNNTTGVTGVSFHTRDQYYSAYTEYEGKGRLECLSGRAWLCRSFGSSLRPQLNIVNNIDAAFSNWLTVHHAIRFRVKQAQPADSWTQCTSAANQFNVAALDASSVNFII